MAEPAISVLLAAPDAALQSRLAAAGLAVRVAVRAAAPEVAEGDPAAEFAPEAAAELAGTEPQVLLVQVGSAAALQALALRPDLPQRACDHALVVLCRPPAQADGAAADALLALGVQAVLPAPAAGGDATALPHALRQAVLRKRAERAARTAYATDLATGLPHQAQLLEHMTQLLALREREPAPMVLLVLRVEGFGAAAARLGSEAGNVLRRKVAVRLRAALRASDVVAAIAPDTFGVLLGRLEAPGDGERVAAKLLRSLMQPLTVAGQVCAVDAHVGLAQYPAHGKEARALLQRSSAQAGSLATLGAAGLAGATERAGHGVAANDAAAGRDP
ncbi:MAG: GGDEF domain-containing protein [Burkholderiales bacterium]|nr:GGDEF domain-containing protein [Burkholderiales bacterium]